LIKKKHLIGRQGGYIPARADPSLKFDHTAPSYNLYTAAVPFIHTGRVFRTTVAKLLILRNMDRKKIRWRDECRRSRRKTHL